MSSRRRDEGDEPADERLGGEGEGDSLLRRVLVAAVLELLQAQLGEGTARPVTGEALEPLSVVAVDRGVWS